MLVQKKFRRLFDGASMTEDLKDSTEKVFMETVNEQVSIKEAEVEDIFVSELANMLQENDEIISEKIEQLEEEFQQALDDNDDTIEEAVAETMLELEQRQMEDIDNFLTYQVEQFMTKHSDIITKELTENIRAETPDVYADYFS